MRHFQLKSFFLKLATVCAFTATLVSCEKEVHINLGSSPPLVVVEGAIETNLPPYVFLTSTISFFSDVSLTTLQNSFLHGANIQVSDGTDTITLKEYSFDTGVNSKFYIYTVDTSKLANVMVGQADKFYTLIIQYNGTTYTSVTKIPSSNGLDSVWLGRPSEPNSKTPDSAWQLYANYIDPDTPGNYVRYFTEINSQQFFPSGLFSDALVVGKTINDIPLYAGYNNAINANADSLLFFYTGDTVTLKWCTIDQKVYNFWNTELYAASAAGNPFASPINVQSNISNGALGVWAGYGSILYTRIVP